MSARGEGVAVDHRLARNESGKSLGQSEGKVCTHNIAYLFGRAKVRTK